MKIIIEGPNGSGKSTLAEQLSEKLNLKIHWAGPKPLTDKIAVEHCQKQLSIKSGIFDRFTPISRQVYGDNNEDINGLSQAHIEVLWMYIRLVAPDSIFIHTIGRGDHKLKPYYTSLHIEKITSNSERIRHYYNLVFGFIPHIAYDFDTHDMNWLIQQIRRFKNGDNIVIGSHWRNNAR